jgi:GAF domain-containing protein
MKRPAKASGKGAKVRRIAASKPKRASAQSKKSLPNSSAAGAPGEIARLTRELNEALERQAATSQVLEVISGSPGDLQAVFVAVLENAVRLCDANFGILWQCEGKGFRCIALHNAPSAFSEDLQKQPVVYPPPGSGLRILAETRRVIHVADLAAMPTYTQQRAPSVVAAVELGGVRTYVAVPMLKKNELIGALIVYRQEVRPFSDKQIELVQNFAAQAVIAIENARLLNELRESLRQQTATADVLKAVSRSTFDLQAVLDALVESAARLCAADKSAIQMRDEDVYRIRAHYGLAREAVQYAQLQPLRPGRNSVTGRVALEGKAFQVSDVLADPEYHATDYQRVFGYRTVLGVPLLRDGTTIGVFAFQREEVSPFTDKQIELATTFADQAVIAIENTRLFEAEQQRTRELRESLEQQTATSDVLKIISSSPGDLEPVFTTMLENAARICEAKFGNVYLWDGDAFRLVAAHNTPPAFAESRKRGPFRPNPGHPFGALVETKQVFHITDVAALPGYKERDPQIVEPVELGGIRTCLGVPMLKDNNLIGALVIFRQEVRPFSDKQIELVKSFAAQAVIAIENARLLNELRTRTEDLSQRTTDLAEADL